MSKLYNNKLTIKYINKIIYNVNNMEEETGESDGTKPKIKIPYKNIKKKEKKKKI